MHRTRYKISSFILATILFLTGVYLDTAAWDAYFLCDFIGETALCPRSLHTNINNSKICDGEMLNECSGTEQQPVELYPLLSLLHAYRVSLSRGKFFRYIGMIQPFCRTPDGLVTDYMHQSDGKKRT